MIVLSQIGVVFFLFQITNGLYSVKVCLADDGLMGILHNGPFRLRQEPVRYPGVKLRATAALYHMAQVDLAAQDILYRFHLPGLGLGEPLVDQDAFLVPVAAGGQNPGIVQPADNACIADALQFFLKNHSDHFGGLRINDDPVPVRWVFDVAIGGVASDKLPMFDFLSQNRAGLSGNILGIYLIHQVF